MYNFIRISLVIFVCITFYTSCHAGESGFTDALSQKKDASQLVPVHTETISPLGRRLKEEEKLYSSSFILAPHRQNYFLIFNYTSKQNTEIYESTGQDIPKKYEAKFQISFKVLAWREMFGSNADLFVAYTQRSVWQLYDRALSSPFRETNYEPEVFVKFNSDFHVGGLTNRIVTIGFNHQSNGESKPLSRNWNRIFASFIAEKGNFALMLKPWYRIPSIEEDEVPNIEKYFGYGELIAAYHINKHIISLMFRNNLRTDENKGAIELGWSYPFTPKVRGYVQYFNGYGESLIDYNHAVNRIGFGVMLNDWI